MTGLAAGYFSAVAAVALAGAATSVRAASPTGPLPIVELRQYTLHEGQRDTLINLFEHEIIESQEALGMKVIGTFRDLDRPNRFVWLRGFTSMDARLAGLSGFYGGPIWQARRNEANATIDDSDNVLLLHAPVASAAFKSSQARPALGEKRPSGLVVATIYYLKSPPAEAQSLFESKVQPRLGKAGVPVLAWFVPETAANNYPRLPVRQGERVLVWFTRYHGDADRAAHTDRVARAETALKPFLARAPEVLRLQPTDRSELR